MPNTALHSFLKEKHSLKNFDQLFIEKFNSSVVKIDEKDEAGNTLLHLAIRLAKIQVIQFLLSHNPNLELTNDIGLTPLLCAVLSSSSSFLSVIESLLKKGADVNHCEETADRASPLIRAILSRRDTQGRIKVMHALINAGANVNLTDSKGNTGLHYAALINCLDSADLLMRNKINTFANLEGRTAVHFAIHTLKDKLVEYVTERDQLLASYQPNETEIVKIQRWYRQHRPAFFAMNAINARTYSKDEHLSGEALRNWLFANNTNKLLHDQLQVPRNAMILFRYVEEIEHLTPLNGHRKISCRLYRDAIERHIISEAEVAHIQTPFDNIKVLQKLKCSGRYENEYRDQILNDMSVAQKLCNNIPLTDIELQNLSNSAGNNSWCPYIFFTTLAPTQIGKLDFLNHAKYVIICIADPNSMQFVRSPLQSEHEWLAIGNVADECILDIKLLSQYQNIEAKDFTHQRLNR